MRARTTLTAFAAAAVTVLVAFAGTAGALVFLYKNAFSRKDDVNQMRLEVGNKKTCSKTWRGKKSLGISDKKGPVECGYRTPVTGDADKPDHDLSVTGKVGNSTAKGIQKHVYLGVSVRAAKDKGYQLRVFPGKQEWELRRKPSTTGFPIKSDGKDKDIKPIGKANTLRLRAFGDIITASINGKKVVDDIKDSKSGDVTGRRTLITLGNSKKSKDKASAFFDNIAIRLPNP